MKKKFYPVKTKVKYENIYNCWASSREDYKKEEWHKIGIGFRFEEITDHEFTYNHLRSNADSSDYYKLKHKVDG